MLTGVVPSQIYKVKAHLRGLVKSNFGRVVSVSEPAVPVDANVVRPKIDPDIILHENAQNNPDVHDFLIRHVSRGEIRARHACVRDWTM
jgi:hypothetical protein